MYTELRELQLKCLEIFDIVDKICRDHQIAYSLCGGSVVGAHLYKGFLPWDDDVDLMMTRDNFDRFIAVAEECLPSGFTLMTYKNGKYPEGVVENFCKVVNENTTIVQHNGYVIGVFLDITTYDRVPENFLKHIDLFLYKRAMTIKRGKKPGRSLKNLFRNFLLDTIFSNRRLYMSFFERVVVFLGKHSRHYTYRELFGAYYFKNMIPYKPSIFEHYTEIDFEGRRAMIVRDYIDYLQTRYDRMDFYEPLANQVPQHFKYINLNQPFRQLLDYHERS